MKEHGGINQVKRYMKPITRMGWKVMMVRNNLGQNVVDCAGMRDSRYVKNLLENYQ